MTSKEQKQYDELNLLVADPNFTLLLNMLEGDNMLEFFGIEKQEIKHSRALANLFDVSGKYAWGSLFVEYFLKAAKVSLPTGFDYSSLKVQAEFPVPPNSVYKDKGSIDILLYSDKEKTVILIENKIDSDESSDQLAKYEYGITLVPAFAGYTCHYIFLTKDGRKAKTAKTACWLPVSYREVIGMIEDVVPKIYKLKLGARMLDMLEQYKQFIRRKIVMDEQLENLCKQLNADHPNAINALAQFKTEKLSDANKAVSKEIEKTLKRNKNVQELTITAASRGSSTFKFKSANLEKNIAKTGVIGVNPVIYTITIETAVVSEEVSDQYYVCFGDYDKSVTDPAVQARILQIYNKTDITKRLLGQNAAKEGIKLSEVYDETTGSVKPGNQIVAIIDIFLARAKAIEDLY